MWQAPCALNFSLLFICQRVCTISTYLANTGATQIKIKIEPSLPIRLGYVSLSENAYYITQCMGGGLSFSLGLFYAGSVNTNKW